MSSSAIRLKKIKRDMEFGRQLSTKLDIGAYSTFNIIKYVGLLFWNITRYICYVCIYSYTYYLFTLRVDPARLVLLTQTQTAALRWPGGEAHRPFCSEGGLGFNTWERGAWTVQDLWLQEDIIHVWTDRCIGSHHNAHNHPAAEGECSLQENIGRLMPELALARWLMLVYQVAVSYSSS